MKPPYEVWICTKPYRVSRNGLDPMIFIDSGDPVNISMSGGVFTFPGTGQLTGEVLRSYIMEFEYNGCRYTVIIGKDRLIEYFRKFV